MRKVTWDSFKITANHINLTPIWINLFLFFHLIQTVESARNVRNINLFSDHSVTNLVLILVHVFTSEHLIPDTAEAVKSFDNA